MVESTIKRTKVIYDLRIKDEKKGSYNIILTSKGPESDQVAVSVEYKGIINIQSINLVCESNNIGAVLYNKQCKQSIMVYELFFCLG